MRTSSVLEHGFFLWDEGTPLEEDSASDSDNDEEVEEDELNELLFKFNGESFLHTSTIFS